MTQPAEASEHGEKQRQWLQFPAPAEIAGAVEEALGRGEMVAMRKDGRIVGFIVPATLPEVFQSYLELVQPDIAEEVRALHEGPETKTEAVERQLRENPDFAAHLSELAATAGVPVDETFGQPPRPEDIDLG